MTSGKPTELKNSLRSELAEFAENLQLQINDLDAQIAGLQKERQKLATLYQNARGLLEGEGEPVVIKDSGKPIMSTQVSASVPTKEMPFRDIIRNILKAEDRPMRPVEVARVFEKAKIPYEHKTDLATRIANELYRMRKTGELTKTGKRYHYPKDE